MSFCNLPPNSTKNFTLRRTNTNLFLLILDFFTRILLRKKTKNTRKIFLFCIFTTSSQSLSTNPITLNTPRYWRPAKVSVAPLVAPVERERAHQDKIHEHNALVVPLQKIFVSLLSIMFWQCFFDQLHVSALKQPSPLRTNGKTDG